MDSFELNKIMGAILGTCLGLLSLNIAANAIFHPVKPAKPGYDIVGPRDAGGRIRRALRRSRIRRSRTFWRAPIWPGRDLAPEVHCLPHLRQGRPEPRRPQSLWHHRPREGPVVGFNYSAGFKKAMKGPWTAQELSDFVKNPKLMAPGTSMTFAGIPRPSERADLIIFLTASPTIRRT